MDPLRLLLLGACLGVLSMVAAVVLYFRMARSLERMANALDRLIGAAMADDVAQLPDEGFDDGTDPTTLAAPDSTGCTNVGFPPCSCINVVDYGSNPLHVDVITSRASSSVEITGRHQIWFNDESTPRYQSPQVTIPGDGKRHRWSWQPNQNYADGTVICARFRKSDGSDLHGRACVTVHS